MINFHFNCLNLELFAMCKNTFVTSRLPSGHIANNTFILLSLISNSVLNKSQIICNHSVGHLDIIYLYYTYLLISWCYFRDPDCRYKNIRFNNIILYLVYCVYLKFYLKIYKKFFIHFYGNFILPLVLLNIT